MGGDLALRNTMGESIFDLGRFHWRSRLEYNYKFVQRAKLAWVFLSCKFEIIKSFGAKHRLRANMAEFGYVPSFCAHNPPGTFFGSFPSKTDVGFVISMLAQAPGH